MRSTALAGIRHGPCRLMGLVPAKTCGWVGRENLACFGRSAKEPSLYL